MMRSGVSAKPGSTKPELRPDACEAIRSASSTATDQPLRASSRAVVSPASPPPITQTSTSRSNVRRARRSASSMVAVYQLGSYPVGSDPLIARPKSRPGAAAHAIDRLVRESDMRRLIVLRHAKAEHATSNGRDFDRTLAARGREDSGKMGAYMARHGLVPERALV